MPNGDFDSIGQTPVREREIYLFEFGNIQKFEKENYLTTIINYVPQGDFAIDELLKMNARLEL